MTSLYKSFWDESSHSHSSWEKFRATSLKVTKPWNFLKNAVCQVLPYGPSIFLSLSQKNLTQLIISLKCFLLLTHGTHTLLVFLLHQSFLVSFADSSSSCQPLILNALSSVLGPLSYLHSPQPYPQDNLILSHGFKYTNDSQIHISSPEL